jgi:hypothetical protein
MTVPIGEVNPDWGFFVSGIEFEIQLCRKNRRIATLSAGSDNMERFACKVKLDSAEF